MGEAGEPPLHPWSEPYVPNPTFALLTPPASKQDPPLVLTGLFHVLFSDVTLPWGAHQLLFNGWNSSTFEHPQSRIKPGEPVGCRRKDPSRWGAAIDSIGVKMLSTVGCPQPSHQGAAGKNRRQTRLPALFLPYVDLHSAFPKFYIWETLVFSPK